VGLKQGLKKLAARIANTRVVRSSVVHLVYPTVLRCLNAEIQPDVGSPSGLIEALGWKTHSLIIKEEELAAGKNCSGATSESTPESRARLFEVVFASIDSVPGDIFEFGVSSGESFLLFLERCPGRQVFGFDSWEGLPEQWWTRPKGTFAAVPPQFTSPNGHLVKGWYDESVPRFFREWNGGIALLHIDCDLYSSTATAFRYALSSCGPGSVVVFDEYYNYPGFAEHEYLAWRNARQEWGITARCIGFDGRRAAFKIHEITLSQPNS